MAPQEKSTNDSKKQKSLMSWFGKDPTSKLAPKIKPATTTPAKTSRDSDASSVLQTPDSKSLNTRKRKLSSAPSISSSDGGDSIHQTPPTSDVIDVDMSDDGEQHVKSRLSKRKSLIVDSDEEASGARNKSSYRNSSPLMAQGRQKKRRLSLTFSDEDEDEDIQETKNTFTRRLTQFKKSPNFKGRKSRSNASDDDDFIAPSDSDIETKSVKSASSRSSNSSRHASEMSDEDLGNEDEVNVKKKGSKTKKAAGGAKRSGKVAGETTTATGGMSFLTAAEQREQEKKLDKKAAEDPYEFLIDMKDKDGRKPGEPNYDPRTLFIPKGAWASFTPFEKQFWEIKQNHYDTILFFQKGKFLELYEDDARVGHQQFDLKLTHRVKMSMVGVPEMSFNFWAAKFLGKGYKVGRVDQAETALGAEMRMAADKSKGKASQDKGKEKIVRRELNKVYTNGTLVDADLLTDDQAGHCIAISEEPAEDGSDSKNSFGTCVLDCSTSQFDLSAFEDDICRTKLETLMRQLRPKEILFVKGNLTPVTERLLKMVLPATCLWTSLRPVEGPKYTQTLEELKSLYPADEDTAMDDGEVLPSTVPEPIRKMLGSRNAILALGYMIWYLRQLNIDKDILSMKNFNIYDPMKRGHGLVLDGQTLAHLEVLLNNEGTEDGSLLKLLSRCATPFGKRLFRIWLCMPLREIADINSRLDAVEALMSHPTFEGEFNDVAKGLPDLERIVSRIHANNCRVRDFLKVLAAFRKLSVGLAKLADESESFESKTVHGLLRGAPDLLPNIKNVENMFNKPSSDKDDELVPRKGKDSVYDEVMAEIEELEEGLQADLESLQKKAGLKLAFWHSAQGNKEIYLVEVSATEKNIPKQGWVKTNSTKAKNRYIVASLQPKIRQLKEARENRNAAIKAFKHRLFAEFDEDRAVWLRAIRVFAELDCLFSLAKASTAFGEPACRPEFVEGDSACIDFKELRHPTLCLSTNLKSFIPNDVRLGGSFGRIALLTGPNMAGKSTVMRMTATGVIMAQLGMLVPARAARLCPVDSIITRMGAYDNMFSNASTFKVELDECCKILREATPKSLVILDELGRGTSTYDGMAIAGAVLHQLATHTLPLSFFATHYGSLTDDFAYHPNIRTMHMSTLVDEDKRDLVFLFKLVEGVATSSFGTHVANLAGVPRDVVDRADLISKQFAQQFRDRMQKKKANSAAAARFPSVAQADFAYLVKLGLGEVDMPAHPVRKGELFERFRALIGRHLNAA
ncbi:DNA mismatch repair protein msh6 [Infundibulicybe gibba]|nr:DNA mismatch repair protein msh6 [Infundibulicybe gibba]